MKITLKTLTPLWTGGVDGESNRVQETGVIGSLRWWYEVIVRGLGGEACDPTTHHCQFDEGKFKRPASDDVAAWRRNLRKAGLCDACQAYGATGWAQRYRLRVRGGKPLNFQGALNVRPQGRNRGWYLLAGLNGNLRVDSVPRLHYDPAMLLAPLALAEAWGALGARTQHGYGVVAADVKEDGQPVTVDQAMIQSLPSGNKSSDEGLPSLRNMFFAKAAFKVTSIRWWQQADGLRDDNKLRAWIDSGSVPVSPAIRNYLRYKKGVGIHDYGPENFLFGSSQPVCKLCYNRRCGHRAGQWERVKTKLHISAAYAPDGKLTREIRIWGWLPHDLPRDVRLDRERVLDTIHDLLGNQRTWRETLGPAIHFDHLEWREFGAPTRDTQTGDLDDPRAFLAKLLAA